MRELAILFAMAITMAPNLVSAQTEIMKNMDADDRNAPLKVTSDRMVSDNKNNVISFCKRMKSFKLVIPLN